jgi:regulatory protein
LGAMSRRAPRKPRPPLDQERLNELALFYVGRYATTRAKLASFLNRKIRERGWEGDEDPDVERLVERFSETGLVNDASYALSKSRSLSERGYGGRRVSAALRAAGIHESDGVEALDLADGQAAESALKYARKKRIGPFAAERPDPRAREKALGSMVRAGHSFELARALVDCSPGSEVDLDDLRSRCR